jgi:hypothetical protein
LPIFDWPRARRITLPIANPYSKIGNPLKEVNLNAARADP